MPVRVEPWGPTWPKATVLVVDDDREVLDIVAMYLRSEGFEVIEIQNAAEAVNVCAESQSIDLVLSDYKMPGMNGMELGKTRREVRPDLPTLFMSGNCEAEDR
jgi:CheY-like chemotaxis protein